MRFRLKNTWSVHPQGVKTDGVEIEAVQWRPGSALPSWCAYMCDSQSLPGKLMILTNEMDGGKPVESVAHDGDFIVQTEFGYLMAIDPDLFVTCYKEVS